MKVIKGTHLAVSDFKADTLHAMWIDNLTRSPLGIDRVTDKLGFTRRATHKGKLRFPEMPCIRCGATTPTVDPNRWTVFRTPGTFPHNPSNFRCELGEHSFSLADLIDHYCPTKQKLRALLKGIGNNEPQLIRTYTAECGDFRDTGKDAEAVAKEVLPAVHDCKVRLVGIDAPSVEIGRQIAGQCRDDLPWATVDVTPDGSLVSVDWHKGRLTDVERLRMTNRDRAAHFKKTEQVEKETASFRRQRRAELGL